MSTNEKLTIQKIVTEAPAYLIRQIAIDLEELTQDAQQIIENGKKEAVSEEATLQSKQGTVEQKNTGKEEGIEERFSSEQIEIPKSSVTNSEDSNDPDQAARVIEDSTREDFKAGTKEDGLLSSDDKKVQEEQKEIVDQKIADQLNKRIEAFESLARSRLLQGSQDTSKQKESKEEREQALTDLRSAIEQFRNVVRGVQGVNLEVLNFLSNLLRDPEKTGQRHQNELNSSFSINKRKSNNSSPSPQRKTLLERAKNLLDRIFSRRGSDFSRRGSDFSRRGSDFSRSMIDKGRENRGDEKIHA